MRRVKGCEKSNDRLRVPLLDPIRELRHTGVVKFSQQGSTVPRPVPSHAVDGDSHGHTRSAIIQLLLESGPTTARSIGARLGLSPAGVRRHLDALIEAGDAKATAAAAWQQEGRGRPAKRYQLTAEGRAKLDHAYDDLASAAMRQLREIGGDEAVQAFARQRIDTILADIRPVDGPADSADVEAAAERIADAFTGAGYATTTARVRGPMPGVQICQHHCPVSHVAEEFPELCEAEEQAMAEVLGTHVQRLATIVNGDCACTTHVPLSAAER
ncbi:helix-turn-helix transcriptional regulator [Mycobacterium sp. SMC-4]|uniref:helix-turn-helix transcriptional regulator n=1 Tax=Mycobacterium sp. SMC-4 TaxID=2857059 RepID=UPI003D056B73